MADEAKTRVAAEDVPPVLCPRHTQRGSCGVDRAIAELAAGQHGVVARRQLLTFAGSDAIAGRVRRGTLHQVHRGVYAVGHSLLGVRGRWKAATMALGSGAVLSHRSAGQLWGLFSRVAIDPEVTITRGWRGRPGVRVHRSPLPDDEVARIDGIPVTSLSRTLLDLGAMVSKRQLERALNEADVRGLTDALSLPDLLERYPRRQGTAVLRRLLADNSTMRGVTRSELEERFVTLLDASGIPRPRLNADIAVGGRFFSVDCLWAAEKLVVELDGRAAHGTALAFEADRERDRLLLSAGWRVMRVTWRQLCGQAPAIADDLRRALAGGLHRRGSTLLA